ncbi:MAG: GNAT family N-acetyltransferase [Actinobacteria bacterium]|nr:GNAT family N-acetyltransferase [Actinomycetota bacterium]
MTIAELAGLDERARRPPEYEQLLATMSDLVGRDLRLARSDQLLVDDLGCDSLAMVEALAMLDAVGAEVPDDLIAGLRTVGDLHHYLHSLANPQAASAPRAYVELEGPNVRLGPVTQRHFDWLYTVCSTGRHLVRFRLRGQTPSPEAFHRFLWEHVLAQFVVSTQEGEPVGLVTSFEPNHRHRYAHLAAVADPARSGDGLVLEGMAVLITYLFAQFDLRKLYAESLESNFAQFDSGTARVFDIEGRLRAHEYVDGAYQDFIVAAIWRDQWRTHHQRILGSAPPY